MDGKRYEAQFKAAKIPKNQVTEILPMLEKLVKAGISQKDLDIVVKEIAINTSFRERFIRDPIGAAKVCSAFKVEIEG